MSERQDGYGKFFKQARQASGLSLDSGTARGNSRRQFNVKPERDSSSASSKSSSKSSSQSSRKSASPIKKSSRFSEEMSRSRGGDSYSTREADIDEIIRRSTPEENLRSELGKKINARTTMARKKKNSFPKGATLILTVMIIGAGTGYYRPDLYETLASRVEIGFFGQARAADESAEAKEKTPKGDKKSTKRSDAKTAGKEGDAKSPSDEVATLAANSEVGAEKSADGGDEKADEKTTNIHGWTPEELSFFNKLNDRKKQLDLREAELNKLEAELQKQKLTLDEKIKQLDRTRDEISATLKTRVTTDQAKVDKLVDFYSTMKPQQAAKVIESLNEDLAVSVLDKMKKKNAAEVLNVMDAKKARRFSELLTGYERSPASPEAGASGDANSATK